MDVSRPNPATVNPAHLAAAAALLGLDAAELRRCIAGDPAPQAKDRLLRIREAAEILGVSTRTVAQMLHAGRLVRVQITPNHARLDGRRVGGRVGIPLSSVERIISGNIGG